MRAWIVWSVGLLAYIVAVLDRTTLGVSGLQAANRFGVSPGVLSSFVVLQVVVYAAAQVPAGVLLDKFGPKTLIATGGALMDAGQLTLAFTTSLLEAIGARAVLGRVGRHAVHGLGAVSRLILACRRHANPGSGPNLRRKSGVGQIFSPPAEG